MIEYAVIGLAVILALAALGAVVALLLSFRTPRPFEPAVPDDPEGYVPPGPNPQAIDEELMQLLDPSWGPSRQEARR